MFGVLLLWPRAHLVGDSGNNYFTPAHQGLDWIGLDLFNDDTCPSGHISCRTQVNVSQSCFNSLNILLKLDYIVQVWGLVEVNCIISDRRIPLLAGIPLCKSRELSRRGYSMSQLCSIHHDIPVTLWKAIWVFIQHFPISGIISRYREFEFPISGNQFPISGNNQFPDIGKWFSDIGN